MGPECQSPRGVCAGVRRYFIAVRVQANVLESKHAASTSRCRLIWHHDTADVGGESEVRNLISLLRFRLARKMTRLDGLGLRVRRLRA